MSNQNSVNLGLVQAIYVGTTPPQNQQIIWFDNNDGVKIHKVFDFVSTQTWIELGSGGGGGGAAWGSITGTLSAQTDLQTALNAKLNLPSGSTNYGLLFWNGSSAAFQSPLAYTSGNFNLTNGARFLDSSNQLSLGISQHYLYDVSSHISIDYGHRQLKNSSGTTVLDWSTGLDIAAGSDTWVQYNNAGALGANLNFTYDNVGDILTVGGVQIYGGTIQALSGNPIYLTTTDYSNTYISITGSLNQVFDVSNDYTLSDSNGNMYLGVAYNDVVVGMFNTGYGYTEYTTTNGIVNNITSSSNGFYVKEYDGGGIYFSVDPFNNSFFWGRPSTTNILMYDDGIGTESIFESWGYYGGRGSDTGIYINYIAQQFYWGDGDYISSGTSTFLDTANGIFNNYFNTDYGSGGNYSVHDYGNGQNIIYADYATVQVGQPAYNTYRQYTNNQIIDIFDNSWYVQDIHSGYLWLDIEPNLTNQLTLGATATNIYRQHTTSSIVDTYPVGYGNYLLQASDGTQLINAYSTSNMTLGITGNVNTYYDFLGGSITNYFNSAAGGHYQIYDTATGQAWLDIEPSGGSGGYAFLGNDQSYTVWGAGNIFQTMNSSGGATSTIYDISTGQNWFNVDPVGNRVSLGNPLSPSLINIGGIDYVLPSSPPTSTPQTMQAVLIGSIVYITYA